MNVLFLRLRVAAGLLAVAVPAPERERHLVFFMMLGGPGDDQESVRLDIVGEVAYARIIERQLDGRRLRKLQVVGGK